VRGEGGAAVADRLEHFGSCGDAGEQLFAADVLVVVRISDQYLVFVEWRELFGAVGVGVAREL
jgi:hypothetical protein